MEFFCPHGSKPDRYNTIPEVGVRPNWSMSDNRDSNTFDPDGIKYFADIPDLPVYGVLTPSDSLQQGPNVDEDRPVVGASLVASQEFPCQQYSCTPPHSADKPGQPSLKSFAHADPPSYGFHDSYALPESSQAYDANDHGFEQNSNCKAPHDLYISSNHGYLLQGLTASTAQQIVQNHSSWTQGPDHSFHSHVRGREGMDCGDAIAPSGGTTLETLAHDATLNPVGTTGPCSRNWDVPPLVSCPCARCLRG